MHSVSSTPASADRSENGPRYRTFLGTVHTDGSCALDIDVDDAVEHLKYSRRIRGVSGAFCRDQIVDSRAQILQHEVLVRGRLAIMTSASIARAEA